MTVTDAAVEHADRPPAVPSSPVAGTPLLVVDDVTVRFGPLLALDRVSLTLRGGDFLGLLGANGAGKTTLMRVICGLQSVRSGGVRLTGEPMGPRSNDLLRHIGFTPDTPPLYDGLTVRQFLRFVGCQYQLDAADVDERIDLWLEKLWLADKADSLIKGLSRGMRQRIGIARTLLPNPALVVLDEPAAGLDPGGRVQFRDLLSDLRRQGKALIVSSHVLSDLGEQCTHIGLMAGGRLTRFEPIATFTGAADKQRGRYRVHFAGAADDALGVARGVPGVYDVRATADGLTLEAGRDPAAAAAVLSALIGRGLAVAAFTPVAVDLEQAYLRASDGPGDA